MKSVEEILKSSLEVLEYISDTTPQYKKKKKKLEKMLKLYEEDREAFFLKYTKDAEIDDERE